MSIPTKVNRTTPFKTDDFKVEKASLEDIEDYASFIHDHFCSREQLTLGLGVPQHEFTEYIRQRLSDWIMGGASVIVKYVPTNQLAGILMSNIITKENRLSYDDNNMENFSENMHRIIRVANILENGCDLFSDPEVQKVVDIVATAVDPEFSGNKLTYRLTEECERLAAELGCKLSTAQSTNKITQHIRRKMGYEECFRMDYETLELDGIRVMNMDALNGTTFAVVFKKYLNKK